MLKIEINCEPSELDNHLKALSFSHWYVKQYTSTNTAQEFINTSVDAQTSKPASDKTVVGEEVVTEHPVTSAILGIFETAAAVSGATRPGYHASGRKVGEPGEGRKRRNSAEVEEDKAYLAAHPGEVLAQHIATENAQAGISTGTASISTGEERVSPEDAAQDQADETAEHSVAALAAGLREPTLDGLRIAVGNYQRVVGIGVAARTIKTVLGKIVGKEECSIIEVPADKIGEAIKTFEKLSSNGAGMFADPAQNIAPEPIETGKPVEATSADCDSAIWSYAAKYDGVKERNPALLAHTLEDVPKLFTQTFGAGVVSMKTMKEKTPVEFGRALLALKAAIEINPFGRAVK